MMKTISGLTASACMGLMLCSCAVSNRPQARAIIAAHDDDSGASLSTSVVAYVTNEGFREAVAARSGLPRPGDRDLVMRPYRDTTLLQVTASAPTSSNALVLVQTSISVVRDHFDATARKQRGDKVRADNAIPEEQRKMAAAIAEGIPRSVIQVVEPPTVVKE
jgi:hypothetical protein